MTLGEILASCFGGASLLIVVAEKLWGGGNALAAKFHTLDQTTTTARDKLREDLTRKIEALEVKLENSKDNYSLGLDAVTANIHALREGLLELRAKMAEEYIAKGGLDEMKADMRRGFEAVDKRMGELQDMIMWAQPAPGNGKPLRNG